MANSRLVAVGCHVSLAPALGRRNVEVKVIEVANQGNVGRLQEMLNRRVKRSVANPAAPHPSVEEADVRWLISQYGDDIRSMERYLYERVQRMEGEADGEMRFCLRT